MIESTGTKEKDRALPVLLFCALSVTARNHGKSSSVSFRGQRGIRIKARIYGCLGSSLSFKMTACGGSSAVSSLSFAFSMPNSM